MEQKSKFDRYQLRKSAGMYWLLDMGQDPDHYKQPIPLNEMGAEIWELLTQGKSQEQIVSQLSAEYEVEAEVLAEDVKGFIKQLDGTLFE